MTEEEAYQSAVAKGAWAGMNPPISITLPDTKPGPLRLTEQQEEIFDQMHSLRLPLKHIAAATGLSVYQLYRRIKHTHRSHASTANSPAWREAKAERIKANIAEYPSRSLFDSGREAA
ncbi:hypothetical protein PRN20_18135 [Devosia sp. ZB163]|uniref:hypothetical protein n=1 Tax=Devosia sp. ZB163 TaxID=3025938 RepID=UPI0023630CC3|nr:hypothetical protein [Devosia sp. ZB163]MDC9825657.1 hypothetical protein [Devosia sp. ZB163]